MWKAAALNCLQAISWRDWAISRKASVKMTDAQAKIRRKNHLNTESLIYKKKKKKWNFPLALYSREDLKV
jgi:hypothetical protein